MKNFLIIFLVLLIISVALWYFFLRKSAKEKGIDYLIEHQFTDGTKEKLMTFGEDYLIAWAAAAKNKNSEFELNGKFYMTQGGTAVK
ncbi:MAG: hypothetical protein AABY22_18010 [Nanoarchaeota archaeon]